MDAEVSTSPLVLLQCFIQKVVRDAFSAILPSKRSNKTSKQVISDSDESKDSMDSPKQKHQGKRLWKGTSHQDSAIKKSHTSTPVEDSTGDAVQAPSPEDIEDIDLWEDLDPLEDPILFTSATVSADPSKGIILRPEGTLMLDPCHIRHPQSVEWSPQNTLTSISLTGSDAHWIKRSTTSHGPNALGLLPT